MQLRALLGVGELRPERSCRWQSPPVVPQPIDCPRVARLRSPRACACGAGEAMWTPAGSPAAASAAASAAAAAAAASAPGIAPAVRGAAARVERLLMAGSSAAAAPPGAPPGAPAAAAAAAAAAATAAAAALVGAAALAGARQTAWPWLMRPCSRAGSSYGAPEVAAFYA
jgi:hypothetical protein